MIDSLYNGNHAPSAFSTLFYNKMQRLSTGTLFYEAQNSLYKDPATLGRWWVCRASEYLSLQKTKKQRSLP
jgi:hypothetical protein